MEQIITIETDEKTRIDQYIADEGILSRNQIKSRNLKVFKKGKELKLSKKVAGGEELTLIWDDVQEINIEAEDIPLNIIFEDENTLIVNKEQGMVVHPANGHYTGTLVQALLFHVKSLQEDFDGDVERPGIVHRLDKDTSGVIITAKNPDALEFLSSQFRDRTNKKIYLAIVKGCPEKKRGTITSYIKRDPQDRKRFMSFPEEGDGKYAETDYVVLCSNERYSLVKLTLKTGRTHQIRVHMKSLGTPILGDPIYSRTDREHPDATLMLHSYSLGIVLPGKEEMEEFTAPVPKRMAEFLQTIELEIPEILVAEEI